MNPGQTTLRRASITFPASGSARLPIAAILPPSTPTSATVRPLYEARDAWEREYLLQALAAFDGNMSRTADALEVERSNLYRKMRGLGIHTRKDDEPV